MKLLNSRLFLTSIILFFITVTNSYAGNPVDSDLSNRAGSNSGNSHLDIYLFIVALLLLCIIVPYFEGKNKKSAKNG